MGENQNNDQYFPFATICIHFSVFALQHLKEGSLIRMCNRERNVVNTVNRYFLGMLRYFNHRRNTKSLSKEQVGETVRQVAEYAKSHTQ